MEPLKCFVLSLTPLQGVPWLWQLAAGLSSQRPGLNSTPVHVECVVGNRHKDRFFSQHLHFTPRSTHSFATDIKYFFKIKCFTILSNISLKKSTNYHPERQWASWGAPFSSSMTVFPVIVCVATNSVSPEFGSWPNHRLSWRFRPLNLCVPKFLNTRQTSVCRFYR